MPGPSNESPILALPYPSGTDAADAPTDMQALVDRIEELLLGGDNGVAGFAVGDLKTSARSTSHGRWLLCDQDRELTQAEIETELSLDAGQAAEIVGILGTGTSSAYGSAATDKVKIPGFRDKVALIAGPTHPRKGTGSTGGEETHTLSTDEIPSHGHGAGTLAAAAHTHAAGSLAADAHVHAAGTLSAASHTHAVGTLVTAAESSHTHGASAMGTDNPGSHAHGSGTYGTDNPGGHTHASGTIATSGAGSHSHSVLVTTAIDSVNVSGTAGPLPVLVPVGGADTHNMTGGGGSSTVANHSHDVTGSTASAGGHTHAVTGSSAATGAHTHAITGRTDAGSAHNHAITGSTASSSPSVSGNTDSAGTTVSGTSGSSGASVGGNTASVGGGSAHNVMQPYRVVGSVFLRV